MKTLIAYTVVDVARLYGGTEFSTEAAERVIVATAAQCGNEPVELHGQAPVVFVLRLFLRLRDSAEEIIYRASDGAPAVVIFSRLDEEKYLRPHDVMAVPWTAAELRGIDTRQKKDAAPILTLDMSALRAKDFTSASELKTFLKKLYGLVPSKEGVTISADAPVVPALFAASWFAPFGTPLYFGNDTVALK